MIKALSAIETGGRTYQAGEVIDNLSREDFMWLKAQGFIEGEMSTKVETKKPKKKTEAKDDVPGDVKA